MARDKGKNNPADDGGAVEVQKDNPEKPVEKAGRNDYILRLMESRRKAMSGEK